VAKAIPRCRKCNHDHYNYLACPDGPMVNPLQINVASDRYKPSTGWGQTFPGNVKMQWGGVQKWNFTPAQHGTVTYPEPVKHQQAETVKTKVFLNQFDGGGSLTLPEE
jgi:hypothetical protein